MAHLTRSQRDQLEALRRAGHTQQEMANILGCHQSTVSRELKRGSPPIKRRYQAHKAHARSETRRQESYCSRFRWQDNRRLLAHVEQELCDGKSPDQIAGRLKERRRVHTVSHASIYRYIEQDKEAGGDLHSLLRYQGKKHKWRGLAKDKTRIPNRLDISVRPSAVNEKKRSGDWESDLVVSSQRGAGAVATFAERTSMYFQAVLVADKSAEEMVRASHAALGSIPEKLRLTMTHDNGREICKHEQIARELNITVYCARPYRSCDRGLNEFMNRELRRFFPKGTDFATVTQTQIDDAVTWLNNCPRRSLSYRTPKEVFREKVMHFTR